MISQLREKIFLYNVHDINEIYCSSRGRKIVNYVNKRNKEEREKSFKY